MDSTINRPISILLLLALAAGANSCAGTGRGEALAPPEFDDVPGASVVWSQDLGRGIEAEPILEGGALFVATTDRRIAEMDPATGHRLWRKRIGGSVSAPLSHHDRDLLAATAEPDGAVYMFDLDLKKVRWKHEVGEISGAATFFEGAVLVATRDGRVFGLSPSEGQPIWVTNLSAPVWGQPRLEAARALFLVPGRDGGVYAVDARSGEKRWLAELDAPLAGVAARGERIAALSVNGELFLLDSATGNRLRKTELDVRVNSGPVWADDLIVVAALDGSIVAVTAETGEIAWRRSLGGPFLSPAGVGRDHLAVAAASGLVWLLERDTGRVIGRVRHPETVIVTPVETAGDWIVAGDRGGVAAYRFDGGGGGE